MVRNQVVDHPSNQTIEMVNQVWIMQRW